jgi:Flp pilus assembly protein TadB
MLYLTCKGKLLIQLHTQSLSLATPQMEVRFWWTQSVTTQRKQSKTGQQRGRGMHALLVHKSVVGVCVRACVCVLFVYVCGVCMCVVYVCVCVCVAVPTWSELKTKCALQHSTCSINDSHSNSNLGGKLSESVYEVYNQYPQ